MTITELAYMLLETARAGHVVDDERIDLRLLKDWIDVKRAKFISQRMKENGNIRFSHNVYQTEELILTVENVTDAGNYPFIDNSVQLYNYILSNVVPPIMETNKSGPLIYNITSKDVMKLPFTIVSYDQLKVSGNGKFNTNIVYVALLDNKFYFKYNEWLETFPTATVKAIFERPRDVTGYVDDTSRYPVDETMIDDLKKYILQEDLNIFLKQESDEANDGSGEIKA